MEMWKGITKKQALEELEIAGTMNPGPWTDHSKYAAQAAMHIAAKSGLDPEKAYVMGLLHDIGRRNGFSALRHAVDGYHYMMEKGEPEIAHICITHNFPTKNVYEDMQKVDIEEDQFQFIKNMVDTCNYDAYDKLIQLCDALAMPDGFCVLEKRFVDVSIRYGVFPYTIARWKAVYEIKAALEEKMECSIYEVLPGIEKSIV